ncbi:MAG TPA: glycine cleavage system aminomethyltransferase GcvT [Polyangiales bacterium]
MNETLKRTPLFETHRAAGARIVPFAGWEMPVQYSGIVEEHRAVRERAGLFDVSHMGELWLRGPRALAVVDSLITNSAAGLAVGKRVYACGCNAQGTILDDLIIYRVADEEVLVVCNAGNRGKMSPHFANAAAGKAQFSDESDETALLALQGPLAEQVLKAAGGSANLLALPRFGIARGTAAGVPVLAARTGYTGEGGFELFVPNADAARLWSALIEAGKPSGLLPVGLGARDTLRLEAGLRLYGNDIDETTDPWEAGLGWTVKLEGRDFLGKQALVERKQRGLTRKLVGIEMVGRGIARHGYPVVDASGAAIGAVTSGSPCPSLGKNLGLAYVPIAQSAEGSPLLVEIRGKSIEAKVVPLPFYKRPG